MDKKSVGESKAKTVCAFLQELNDAVRAHFVEENPDSLILTDPSFFSQFTLVIATQVTNEKMCPCSLSMFNLLLQESGCNLDCKVLVFMVLWGLSA